VQILVALVAALSQGGVLWAWSASVLPAEWVPVVQGVMALCAILAQAFCPAVTLRPQADVVKRAAGGGLIVAVALLTLGCSTVQLHVQPGERELLTLKVSGSPGSPSLIEYHLNGRLRFRRTGDRPIPLRCYRAPGGDRIGPR